MSDPVTKATALHVANEVWETITRHLFGDKTGKRHGAPRVGSWWDFGRIPGRAKSHTKKTRAWETYRLTGTLQGHLDQFRPPALDGLTVEDTASLPEGTSVLSQPSVLPAPARPKGVAGWWDHTGPLTVVFTGLPAGDLVMPVRLPAGAGRWPRLAHFLGDPSVWHKIDLVGVRDPKAPGGWRYYAHLLVHKPGYQSGSTRARRALVPTDRVAGLDANVSNISVASHSNATNVQADQVKVTDQMLEAAQRDAVKIRRRQRALDRSRRNNNPDQYAPSVRQVKQAARRKTAGLKPKPIHNPGGARDSRKDGKPTRAYRKDKLSQHYGEQRADHASHARGASQAKHARAATVAADLTVQHGNQWIAVDVLITNWTRRWGKRAALFSPGMLQTAIRQEAEATGGTFRKASTHKTAMSQHCLCGARVEKDLNERTQTCTECGLTAPRDLVSAALAASVTFTDPEDPATARVDYELTGRVRVQLETPSKRGELSQPDPAPTAHAETIKTGSHLWPLLNNATTLRLTPAQPSQASQEQPKKKNPNRFQWTHDPLRVNS